MTMWVILLRAINLGAKNKVPMPALREAMSAAGFRDVGTYVQSGNVVATSAHRSPYRVADAVHDLVVSEFGVDVPVIVRTPSELTAAVAANPFPQAAAERPKALHVWFLAATPSTEGVEALLAEPVAADACQVVEDQLYIDYVDGVHGSTLTPDFLRRRLGVDGTARNWRTVLAIADMLHATS